MPEIVRLALLPLTFFLAIFRATDVLNLATVTFVVAWAVEPS